jgi:FkbM family methyltransferase
MIQKLRDGLGWRWRLWRRYGFLVRSFRNGFALANRYRKRLPCGRVVLWDGTVLTHPPSRTGMLETILEIWYGQVYTGRFYRPSPGDVIIDAGGNVGLFSVWLARRHPRCRVVAFEPFEENYRLFMQNVESAGVKNVAVYCAGLGGETGRGQMEAVGERSLDHRLAADGRDDAPGSVPVYSFADALRLADSPRVALFKVDIEGSEYELFEKADPADLARVNRFAIEYHEHAHPGVVDLLRAKLAPTHDVTVSPGGPGYGMLYATIRTRGTP